MFTVFHDYNLTASIQMLTPFQCCVSAFNLLRPHRFFKIRLRANIPFKFHSLFWDKKGAKTPGQLIPHRLRFIFGNPIKIKRMTCMSQYWTGNNADLLHRSIIKHPLLILFFTNKNGAFLLSYSRSASWPGTQILTSATCLQNRIQISVNLLRQVFLFIFSNHPSIVCISQVL